jgi:hypothetical protein
VRVGLTGAVWRGCVVLGVGPSTAGVGAWCPGVGPVDRRRPRGSHRRPEAGVARNVFPQTAAVKAAAEEIPITEPFSSPPGIPLGTATLSGRIVVPDASEEIALIRWRDRAVSPELRRSRPRSPMRSPAPPRGSHRPEISDR